MLQRKSDGGAEIVPMERPSGLLELLSHHVMRRGTAEHVIRQSANLITDVPVSIFRYASLDEAASRLQEPLARPLHAAPEAMGTWKRSPRRRRLRATPARALKERPGTLLFYVQAPDVRTFSEHGSLFLTDMTSNVIFSLNGPGEILWNMLEQPLSEREASLLFQETFPSVSKSRIQRDVEELFSNLKNKKLIIPCPPPTS